MHDALKYTLREQLPDGVIAELVELIKRIAPNEGPRILELLRSRVIADYQGVDLFGHVMPARCSSDDLAKVRTARFNSLAGLNARLLELGPESAWPDERVKQFLFSPPSITGGYSELIRLDFDDTHKPDLVASCFQMPLAESAVDHVRSNSLLEHVKDTRGTLEETFRVLSPGGYMEHTMPLHFHLHGYPKDYSRLSPDYFREVLTEIGFTNIFIDVRTTAGRIYTCLNTMNSFDVIALNSEQRALLELVKTALLLLSELDFADRGMEAVAHSISVIARKPGLLTSRKAVRDKTGALVIPLGTTALSRISLDIVHPITKKLLQFRGSEFADADLTFPIRNGSAYLRPQDAIHKLQGPQLEKLR